RGAPSQARTSRRRTFAAVVPLHCAVAPHELLPTIPPIVQWLWVDGRGPKTRPPYRRVCAFTSSSTAPGCTIAVRASASTDSTACTYFDQSSMTATLQHWPPRLVPPPRDSTGTACSRHTATASTASSTSRGTTTPIGTWR